MSDISDVDLQLVIAVRQLADEDSIIEIAGSLAIDGNDGQVAIVLTTGDLAPFQHRCECFGFFQNLRWEDMRNMVLANHNLDIDSEVIFVAEHLNDFTASTLRA